MNQRLANILNPMLMLFGRKIVRRYIGHWSAAGGGLKRELWPRGWRMARRAEYEGLPEKASELDRFCAARGLKM